MDEYLQDFVEESEDHITQLNNDLLTLERSPDDRETMDSIFRTVHTIKGNASAAGLDTVSDLAHAFEDLLEGVRAGHITVTSELMDVIFDGVDELERLIDEVTVRGSVETEPSEVIAALREPIDRHAKSVSRPTDEEIEALVSGYDPLRDDEQDGFLARMAITESSEINNGLLVLEALIDAFDLLGTDPPRSAIEDERYPGVIDAVFGSAVGERAIAAALEPVDAVTDFEIVNVTDALERGQAQEQPPQDPFEEGIGANISSEEAQEMGVDELLDEFTELDDIEELAEDIDASDIDEIGDAGSFDDIIKEPSEPTEADEPAEAAGEAEADDGDEMVDDASAVFEELKEEVEMVGFDELQEELDELEFDEFDDEEEVGMDELLGDDFDPDDPTFLDVEVDQPESATEAEAVDATTERDDSVDETQVPEPSSAAETQETDTEPAPADTEPAPTDDTPIAEAGGDASDLDPELDEAAEEILREMEGAESAETADSATAETGDEDESTTAESDSVEKSDTSDHDGTVGFEDDLLSDIEFDDDPIADVTEDAGQSVDAAGADGVAADANGTAVDVGEEASDAAIGDEGPATDDTTAVPKADAGSEEHVERYEDDVDDPVSADELDEDVTVDDSSDLSEPEIDALDEVDVADIGDTDFDDAVVAEPDFDATDFDDEAFADADFDEEAFADAEYDGADFDEEAFADAEYDGADFDEEAFADAEYDGADFDEEAFADADIDDATFADADFDEADFDDEAFTDADIDEIDDDLVSDVSVDEAFELEDLDADATDSFDEAVSYDEEMAFDDSSETIFDDPTSFGADDSDDETDIDTEAVLEKLGTMAIPDIDVPEQLDAPEPESVGAGGQSVRVERDQIDTLLRLVEGLVNSRVRLRNAIEEGQELAVISNELDDLEDITSELQETVMDVRLVPLQTVTNRLPRVVRDLAREQDKEVVFEQTGETVELDRSILDRIGDPLIHLVRNAVDHGIEPPEDREAADKPREGTVELSAERARDRVTIEISDDGSGLDPDRIRSEAIEAGIIDEADAVYLPDEDAYDLVFHSGLSTAEEVTDVSGRGVGMDVVRRTAEELNGSVEIDSEPGEGTTVTLTLPVTVAIADVLFVECGGEEFGVPVKVVNDVTSTAGLDLVEGELVYESDTNQQRPVIELGQALGVSGRSANGDGMVIRVRDEVREVALHCDNVQGRQEVVVKPFEGFMRNIPGVSGATVRGRGEVVTILDVSTL